MAQPIWNTPAGTLGSYPALTSLSIQLSATPVSPAISVSYILLSGSLPGGLSLNSSGLILGIPSLVEQELTTNFSVRVTDNLGNIKDRTFSLLISGSTQPEFITPAGNILSIDDSVWLDYQIQYDNPVSTNIINIEVREGNLPPGLEINSSGNIRGYALPPTIEVTLPEVLTTVLSSSSMTNEFTCLSTNLFSIGRPVLFSNTIFGGISAGITYYIKTITSSTTFTISSTQDGPVILLNNGSGFMDATLPNINIGQPIIRTYSFVLKLSSDLGTDTNNYSITVINQNTPVSQGGPGNTPNSRLPTILNTRPLTFNIDPSNLYFGYYILPPVATTIPANIGTVKSGDVFSFKMIGYDFDSSPISYEFSNLPLGMVGNTSTGWITGTPTLPTVGFQNYNFNVRVYKTSNPAMSSDVFTYGINISNEISGKITWITPSDLGTLFNGEISSLSLKAESDIDLTYALVDGDLPPNLNLSSNGEIYGKVADQPISTYLEPGAISSFTFTVRATSLTYLVISSDKTFTIKVKQEFATPTDILYIKATPNIADRNILRTLLDDPLLIPNSAVYRQDDPNFGKAKNVVYQHAYGIHASYFATYFEAVSRNHYYRQLTLGEIKTAIAKDSNGNIIYEVVYSEIIDNLVNPEGISVAESINWPRPIDLGLGPWYTSVTNVYTSYVNILGQQYYTSLTSGTTNTLYPNSLQNMRKRVASVAGQDYSTKLLPLWMTSQQENGSTLGFIPAWVICYTKPGFSETIKNNINNNWGYFIKPSDPNSFVKYTLNQINFEIDRFSVNKSSTFNYDDNLTPPAWTSLPSAQPPVDPLAGDMDVRDFYVLFPRTTILPNRPE